MALIDLVNVSKVYEHASRPALEDVNVIEEILSSL